MSDTKEREEHERLVMEKVRLEDEAAEQDRLTVRGHVLEYLKDEKLYSDEDIETDTDFEVYVGEECRGKTSTDIIIKAGGRRLIAVKCVSSSIESGERHILSFGRVADEFIVPISIITDAEATRIFDTITGRLLSEDIGDIPSMPELRPGDYPLERYPTERAEREKRILLAFESIACRVPSE